MERKTLLWTAGLGLTGFAITLGFVLARDVTWNWPLVAVLVLILVLPTARAFGSSKARDAGARLRERRGKQ